MTDELSDPARRALLFAPLRPRDLNPTGHDAKVAFWRDAIVTACRGAGSVRVRGADLAARFATAQQMPRCIDSILHIMVSEGQLVPRSDWLAAAAAGGDCSWSRWLLARATRHWPLALWRALSRSVLSGAASSPAGTEELLCVPALQHCSDELLRRFATDVAAGACPSVVSDDQLFRRFGATFAGRADFDLTVEWSRRAGRLLVAPQLSTAHSTGALCVKLNRSETNETTTISDTDLASVRINCAIDCLSQHCEQVERKRQEAREKAKHFRLAGDVKTCRWWLRQYGQLSGVHDKYMGTVHNLHSLQLQLQQTNLNQQVLDAMRDGTQALQSVHSTLSVDSVESAMDNLNELMEWSCAVSSQLSSGLPADSSGRQTASCDEIEQLELELQQLLQLSDNDDRDSEPQLPCATNTASDGIASSQIQLEAALAALPSATLNSGSDTPLSSKVDVAELLSPPEATESPAKSTKPKQTMIPST